MAGDSAQKTEKPTPKKLAEARKKGQIPRSPDMIGWLSVLVVSFVLPGQLRSLHRIFVGYFAQFGQAVAAGDLEMEVGSARGLFVDIGLAITPMLLVAFVVTATGLAVQGGVVLSADPLKPKLERISIKSGVKRLVSAQSVVDTIKAVVRLIVLAALVSGIARSALSSHLGAGGVNLGASGRDLGLSLLLLLRLAALAGLLVGVADYAFQRHKMAKQLKMSKHEVKQESRTSDGDPMLRSRRRSIHAQLSRNQMLSAVGDASVVVVNPTHVAVALSYEAGAIPTVVAKGGDELALRIRERAFEAGIPVVEARPLARMLHDDLDVGAEVPAQLYEAVAIVIAFVMRSPQTAFERMVRTVSVPASKLGGANVA